MTCDSSDYKRTIRLQFQMANNGILVGSLNRPYVPVSVDPFFFDSENRTKKKTQFEGLLLDEPNSHHKHACLYLRRHVEDLHVLPITFTYWTPANTLLNSQGFKCGLQISVCLFSFSVLFLFFDQANLLTQRHKNKKPKHR